MEKGISLDELFGKILNHIQDGIIVTDHAGKIIFYNRELSNIEDLSPENVVGKTLEEVYEFPTSEHLTTIHTGEAVLDMRKTYFTNKGKEVNIIASTYPVYQNGRIVAVYSVCRDFTKIKELVAKNMQLQDQIGNDHQENSRNNGTRFTFESMAYTSLSMRNLVVAAKKAAEADCDIMIYGETGTGKELLVQSMHNQSSRVDEQFVAINCAAIPETLLESTLFGTSKGAFTGAVEGKGLFEQAGKGTLFLDEINSMSITLQAKLLRVLQERKVRRVGGEAEIPVYCRVVSSTNVDPWECISKGILRKDLFYRLAVISLDIPPLRDRKEDIYALLDFFLKKYQKIYGFGTVKVSSELKALLGKYLWPGNVRELEHTIESSINMLGGETVITIEHLPPYLKSKLQAQDNVLRAGYAKGGGTLSQTLREVEKQVLVEALKNSQGNITKAAMALGIARQNLQYRMRKLGIEV